MFLTHSIVLVSSQFAEVPFVHNYT